MNYNVILDVSFFGCCSRCNEQLCPNCIAICEKCGIKTCFSCDNEEDDEDDKDIKNIKSLGCEFCDCSNDEEMFKEYYGETCESCEQKVEHKNLKLCLKCNNPYFCTNCPHRCISDEIIDN